MSIDFSKVTGFSDAYGNIVEIADASGRVIWRKVQYEILYDFGTIVTTHTYGRTYCSYSKAAQVDFDAESVNALLINGEIVMVNYSYFLGTHMYMIPEATSTMPTASAPYSVVLDSQSSNTDIYDYSFHHFGITPGTYDIKLIRV